LEKNIIYNIIMNNKMKRFIFQIITKDFNLTEEKRYLRDIVKIAVDSFADVLQLRNKKITPGNIYRSAVFIKNILSDSYPNRAEKPLLIINDRPDIAYLSGADGVHIGQDDFPAYIVKKLFPGLILGVSVDDLSQALIAEEGGADYIGVGPVYDTTSKSDAGDLIKRRELKNICNAVNIPVIAIGGINDGNISDLDSCGINGVAVISAISNSEDPLKTACALKKNIDESLNINKCI